MHYEVSELKIYTIPWKVSGNSKGEGKAKILQAKYEVKLESDKCTSTDV